jgi:hypothetical protein
VVNQDFSLTDKTAVSVEQAPARQDQAEQLSATIVAAVEALYDHDAAVAARLEAHGAQLEAAQFTDGAPISGQVRPVAVRAVPVDPGPLAPPRIRA